MKLIIGNKEEINDILYYLADEICQKFSALSPKVTINNLEIEGIDEGEGCFVYIDKLEEDGNNIDIEALKGYKRVIYVAVGPKYQNLLQKVFTEEKSEDLKATLLFDLNDCYIVTDKIGSSKIPKEEI